MFKLKGVVSGKRVEAHIIIRRYSFPDLVFGNEPTQSIMILLKGSSNAGIGCNPALGMPWLGLFNWLVSFDPKFHCCYFCESLCLFYLSFNSVFMFVLSKF